MTRKNIRSVAAGTLIATLAIATAAAQHGEAAGGYIGAVDRMQSEVPRTPGGDTDTDFVRVMIPHHRGATNMAENLLRVSKDVELRRMAAKMIEDQNREIAELQNWLEKKGK